MKNDEKEALAKLRQIKSNHQTLIRENFEFKAKSCAMCETKGACCLDSHFVNVHITQLEAVLIREKLSAFSGEKQAEIYQRIEKTIAEFNLTAEGNTFTQTFACPLFERESGCLIHGEAKPLPCISHACYENKEDLPPQCLEDFAAEKIEKLNTEIYGEALWLPLPVLLNHLSETSRQVI